MVIGACASIAFHGASMRPPWLLLLLGDFHGASNTERVCMYVLPVLPFLWPRGALLWWSAGMRFHRFFHGAAMGTSMEIPWDMNGTSMALLWWWCCMRFHRFQSHPTVGVQQNVLSSPYEELNNISPPPET